MSYSYLGKFDNQGKPSGFLQEGLNYKTIEEKEAYINKGWVEVSQSDWEKYMHINDWGANGTGYFRDPQTGKAVSAPAIVYTKEQLANSAFSSCQSAISGREDAIVRATALGGQDDYIAELRQEISDIENAYASDLEKIESGVITHPDQITKYCEI